MTFIDLKNIAERNEVRIDNTKDRKRTPPYYFDSLRDTFVFYFHTFRSNNSSYEHYAVASSSVKKKNRKILENQFLDTENTVLSIVSCERFFELYIKDILRQTNAKLVYEEDRQTRSKNTWQVIGKIQSNTFVARKAGRKSYTIPFRETLKRFYELIRYTKIQDKKSHPLVKRFGRILVNYQFLEEQEHKSTLEFINWYRDRILHNGNSLPSMRLLDFIIAKKVVPIVEAIRAKTKNEYGDWWYFLETVTKIDLLQSLLSVAILHRNTKSKKQVDSSVLNLLYIGHLKELGRANLNMNWLMQRNLRATFEYNYQDPLGRGKRFAEVEKEQNDHAMKVMSCPCCGNNSLVIYRQQINDIFNNGQLLNIDWVKCYTCDYHLRYNTGEPAYFNLHNQNLFNLEFPSVTQNA